MRTLCVDIGGTGVKALIADASGTPRSERIRVRTPDPAVPETVLPTVEALGRRLGVFDRASVGFPGVVLDGVAKTAPNLDNGWRDFPIADELMRLFGRPVRVINDAGMQGLGIIEGRGTEMLLTFGTGLGCGLYVDGRYVPNLELAHHPFRKGRTYEERVSDVERRRIGRKRWNRRVREVIAQIEPIFNYRKLYVGGGNVKYLDQSDLPERVVIVVDKTLGLAGGVRLWEDGPEDGVAREALR